MIRTTTSSATGRRSTAAPRWALVVGGAAAVAAVLSGCSFSGSVQDAGAATSAPSLSTADPSATSTGSATSTPSGSSTGTSTGSAPTTPTSAAGGSTAAPTGSSTPTPTGGGGAATCRTADLALSLLPGEGGASAGHQHYTIQFTNRGASACTLDGHPGVSLVTGSSGQQLGAAASRQGSPALVRLGAGASAYADLSVAEAGNYDAAQCQPQAAVGLRVYPPDQTASAFVPAQGLTGCASSSVVLLVVDPVVAGR